MHAGQNPQTWISHVSSFWGFVSLAFWSSSLSSNLTHPNADKTEPVCPTTPNKEAGFLFWGHFSPASIWPTVFRGERLVVDWTSIWGWNNCNWGDRLARTVLCHSTKKEKTTDQTSRTTDCSVDAAGRRHLSVQWHFHCASARTDSFSLIQDWLPNSEMKWSRVFFTLCWEILVWEFHPLSGIP